MSSNHGSLADFSDLKLQDLGSIRTRARQMAVRADVSAALSTPAPWRGRFASCTEALVRHLGAAAARIWLVTKDGRTLALWANSGAHTAPGEGTHVPITGPALRRIVNQGLPYVTSDAVNDPNLQDLDWAPGESIAYAGHPLRAGDQIIGVLAMFSRRPIGQATLETLRTIAGMIAKAVQHTPREGALHPSEALLTEAQRLDFLLGAVRRSIDGASLAAEMQVLRDRYSLLSRREREVMALVVAGCLNKQIGYHLGISEITVKAHRGQVMRKMKAFSLADLVKIAVLLQLVPPP